MQEQDPSVPIKPLTADHGGYHIPVLLKESIDGLQIQSNGVYVDCTFGGGGHSRKILQHLGKDGLLVVFDQDEAAKNNLPKDDRILFVPQNFKYLQRFLRLHKIVQVDGILADLGVSSHQFDEADRGFSTRFDAALDMRMDQRQPITAATVLKTFTEQQLHKMLEQYGEVTNARTLAKLIVQQRSIVHINTINEFESYVWKPQKDEPVKENDHALDALRYYVVSRLEAGSLVLFGV